MRLRALREGKTVYMAVPRLAERECFIELDPARIRDFAKAATIAGASRVGRPVHPKKLPRIDLVVAGSVAVDRRGARLGKGGGYSDIEFAIGRMLGKIDRRTVVATTVHGVQVVAEDLPTTEHDFWLDLIVTPDEVIRPRGAGIARQPSGLIAAHLSEEWREAIPILDELA